MRFLQVSALNGLAVAVRMATALILNKILALAVGPGGYAVIGQFQNAMTVAQTLGSATLAQGVTRFTAEHADDPDHAHRIWRTAGSLTLIGCTLAALPAVLASGWLATNLLHLPGRGFVFVAAAAGLFGVSINGLILAILSGRKDTTTFIAVGITGSLVGLIFTGGMAWWAGIDGALVALALNQSLVLGVTLWLVARRPWFAWRHIVGAIDPVALRALGGYALMGGVAALATPIAQTAIRQILVARLGIDAAGHWDGMNRISALAMLFFTSTLSLWYLPRIAEIRDNAVLRREVTAVALRTVPVVAVAVGVMYLLRDFIVRLLFEPAFLPMTDLFAFQMAGDLCKIASWLFAFVMIGRGQVLAFVASEIVFAMTHVGLVAIFVADLGLVGASLAYAVNYLGYGLAVFAVFRLNSRPVPAFGAPS